MVCMRLRIAMSFALVVALLLAASGCGGGRHSSPGGGPSAVSTFDASTFDSIATFQ